jgi:hypothetical protein
MSIPVACSKCAAQDHVHEDTAGTTVACKQCAAPIAVPSRSGATATAIEASRPSPQAPPRRKRDWGDEEEERPRVGKRKDGEGIGTTLLTVAGIMALSCVLCAGVGTVGWLLTFRAARMEVAVAERAAMEAQQAQVMVGEAAKKEAGPVGPVPPGVGKIIFERQGRLMPNDPIRDGKPHKAFTIELEQGQTYVIDMVSTETDAWLNLYDAAGVLVAKDDDGGGNQNARIRYTAAETGDHVIAATVFRDVPPGGARFTLTVREE